MGSSLYIAVKQPEERKQTVLHTLANWWKKKRSFYVDVQPDDSINATMDVDSDHDESPRGEMVDRASVTSSPNFDVTSVHSPLTHRPNVDMEATPTWTHSEVKSYNLAPQLDALGYQTPVMDMTDPDADLEVDNLSPFLSKPAQYTKSLSSGSLESMDSLVESYCDSENEDSASTPVAGNGEFYSVPDCFAEHVHFLRVQTTPRHIEEIWSVPANHPGAMVAA